MDEVQVIKKLKQQLGFSDFSVNKIKKFHDLLLEYNKRYNLISKNTEKSIWFRHILDSAQIIKFINPKKNLKIDDFGSGAGFPGLIVAIYDNNAKFHVKLYEKSNVKRAFLSSVMKDLDLKNTEICKNVYKNKKPHKIIILKGKNAQLEINKVSLGSNYSYKLKSSITDDDSKIIIVEAN